MIARRLTLSPDAKLAGVCGGLANYFDIDPTVVRVAYLLLTVFSAAFPGIVLYLIRWAVLPKA